MYVCAQEIELNANEKPSASRLSRDSEGAIAHDPLLAELSNLTAPHVHYTTHAHVDRLTHSLLDHHDVVCMCC